MIITLSGFEGSGKSTIVDHLKNNKNFLVVPETARILLPLEKTVFEESNDDMSYKSFIAYLSSSHFIFENNLNKTHSVVFDRNLIDSLTYLDMYSEQKIDTQKVQDYLDRFLEEKNETCLYNNVVLIEHSDNEEHIKNNILSDEVRQYSTSVKQYIEDAKKWENAYLENFHKFEKLTQNFSKIKAFPDNNNIISNINNIVEHKKKLLKTN